MAWQDRHYYRDRGNSPTNPLMWLFAGSVPLFTVFGIRVRMHASMLLLIVLGLATSGMQGGLGVSNAMIGSLVLFTIVLLHEFGHCFAARWVGGEANDILMWPLGGLAYCDAPRRPWPQFVTAAGGPMVNVMICLLAIGLLRVINWRQPIQFNPLTGQIEGENWFLVIVYLRWINAISLALLLFNLLPLFPLDGGRLLQSVLWRWLQYYRATLITCVVGMVGSVLMAMYGITMFGSWYGMILIVIGINCFMTCYQLRLQLKAAGPWEFQDDSTDYSAAMWQPEERRRKSRKLSRRKVRRLRRQAQRDEAEQARIDAILSKVSSNGMHSLTWRERRALRKATERQRRREVEVSREL